jgi:hypothetical protein
MPLRIQGLVIQMGLPTADTHFAGSQRVSLRSKNRALDSRVELAS